MLKRTRKLALLFVLSFFSVYFLFAFPLSAANANLRLTTATGTTKTVAPQGSNAVPVMFFEVFASTNETINTVLISNSSNAPVQFGNGITKAYLYRNTAGSTLDTASDTLIDAVTFSSVTQNASFALSGLTSVTSDVKQFFVAYDFSQTATLNATANIKIIDIKNNAGDVASLTTGGTISQNITVSGLVSNNITTPLITSIAPSSVVPGQTGVGMLKIAVQPKGEGINSDWKFTLSNVAGNFASNGVTKVSFYKDNNSDGTFSPTSDTLLMTPLEISAGTLSSASTATLNATLSTLVFSADTSTTLFVAYDISATTNAGTKFNAQITAFNGTGSTSALPITLFNSLPVSAVEVTTGGLSFTGPSSIIPSGSSFGPGSIVPMIQFTLKAEQTDITVNQISIGNTGSVPYITAANTETGVKKISLYSDKNANGTFDKNTDTLVGLLNLGGSGQTAQRADITLSSPVLITANSTKTIFVEYELGNSVSIAGSNNASLVEARLINAVGATSSTSNLNLSGSLPAVPSQSLTLSSTSIDIIDVKNIVSGNVIQGQRKVPTLFIKLKAKQETSGVALTIGNSNNSFLSNSNGVERVWLYKDVNSNEKLDGDDTVVGSVQSFTDSGSVKLPSFTLSADTQSFLVLYDIGQTATISSPNSSAQLTGISTTGNTSITVGGTLPAPSSVASVGVADKYLRIDSVSSEKSTVTTSTPAFNVTMSLTNKSSSAVRIQSVSPRFYKESSSGLDISYEYKTNTTQAFPTTLNAGSTLTVTFSVDPTYIMSQSTVIIDGFASYDVNTSANVAVLSRYQTSPGNFSLVAGTTTQLSAFVSSTVQKSWNIPTYISGITTQAGSTFQNQDALPPNSSLSIQFTNSGNFIDESSIKITLTSKSGATLASSGIHTKATVGSFTYNRSTGLLTITNIGSTSGTFAIKASDLNGNALPTASLSFSVSDKAEISELLVAPSPYSVTSGDLTIGFNLTQPASVTVYVFNMMGSAVYKTTQVFSSTGYQVLTWNGVGNSGNKLASGVYLLRLVATDSSTGMLTKAKTRFAVY